MSLTTDREPVEVHWWYRKRGWAWIKIRRYVIHRNGTLSYLHPGMSRKWCAAKDYWRKVQRESG